MQSPELMPPAGPASAPPRFFLRLAPPLVSRSLLIFLLVVFAGEVIYGIWRYGAWITFSGADLRVLVDMGAKVDPYIAGNSEYWRLYTATLLHDGILHLLFIVFALYSLGPLVEGYFGHWRFLAIYLLSGLFGSLASYAFSDSISVGASGAIFGIIGALAVYLYRYRDNFGASGRAMLQNVLVTIVLNVALGLTVPRIDNWGHMGGLISGAILAWGLLPRYRAPAVVRLGDQPLEEEPRRPAEIAWIALWTVLWVTGVAAATLLMDQMAMLR